MKLLPWLLNWPPRPATIVAFLLVTAFSVGTLVLFAPVTDQIGPDEASVEVANASVHLNDELEIPDEGNGSVVTCLSSGTPGDHLTVRADVVVETPIKDDDATYDLEVSLADGAATMTEPVQQTGRARVDIFRVVSDDETLSVGETTELEVRLRRSESVVAAATRSVTVEEANRSFDCES